MQNDPPTPPPLSAPPTQPGALGPKTHEPDGLETYQRVAETVGMLPSIRWRDNLIQAVIVIAGALVGTLLGLWLLPADRLGEDLPSWAGPAAGAVGGAVAACLLSGVVLMVLGWIRALKK
ncbi:MAG TPA: hypothetical protein PLU35_04545 [Phycisphaerales bacterium]|nr:hypothetical protein [Phycisphaerales bacterium]